MSLFDPADYRFADAVSRLAYCNPFLTDRVELEQRILGDAFTPFFAVWHPRADVEDDNPNIVQIGDLAEALAERLRKRLTDGVKVIYEDETLQSVSEKEFDLVVLAAGMEPLREASAIAEAAGISLDRHGFCPSPSRTTTRANTIRRWLAWRPPMPISPIMLGPGTKGAQFYGNWIAMRKKSPAMTAP